MTTSLIINATGNLHITEKKFKNSSDKTSVLLKPGYNPYPCIRTRYPCPGTGLRKTGHLFFWKKTRCIRTRLPISVPAEKIPVSVPAEKNRKKNTRVPVPVSVVLVYLRGARV
jgi:hypothetical protein